MISLLFESFDSAILISLIYPLSESCVNLIFGDFVFLFLCSSLYWLIAVLRCRRCVVASQLTVFPRAQDGTK